MDGGMAAILGWWCPAFESWVLTKITQVPS